MVRVHLSPGTQAAARPAPPISPPCHSIEPQEKLAADVAWSRPPAKTSRDDTPEPAEFRRQPRLRRVPRPAVTRPGSPACSTPRLASCGGVALHLVGDAATADDLVQSTFLAAIEAASSFDAERDVVPWLIGILRNQALMAQRRQRRRPDPQRLLESRPEDLDPVRRAEDREFDALVDEAVGTLTPAYRPVLELYLKHGLSAAEIASALDRPAGTVRTQIVRGLERLRELLPVGFDRG